MFDGFTVWDGIGVLGVIGYVGAYAALQFGLIRGQSYLYAGVNAVAAGLVLVSLADRFNLAAAAIQVIWIAISIAGVLRLLTLERRARFSAEERAFLDAKLPRLPASEARRALDLGHWVDVEAGALLAEEMQPVDHLIYIAAGTVDIVSHDETIAQCKGGSYVGEVTWTTGAPATATAIAATPCRCLYFNAEALRRLAARSDHVRAAIGASVAASVREKLVLSNVAAASRKRG